MFLSARSIAFYLLKIDSKLSEIGVKSLKITNKKLAYGQLKSITSNEFNGSKALDISLEFKIVMQSISFDDSKFVYFDNNIFKIERFYISGQFLELYLVKTDYVYGDLI